MARKTNNTFGTFDPNNSIKRFSAKYYHSGGTIEIRPNWSYFSACGVGAHIRLGIHYGGSQVGDTQQWNNGQQNQSRTFVRNGLGYFPAGTFGVLGRTAYANCSGSDGGTIMHSHNSKSGYGSRPHQVDMAISYNG